MAWTQYRDGKWRETQVSQGFFHTSYTRNLRLKQEFYFFGEQTDEGTLYIRCRLIPREYYNEDATEQILHYNDATDSLDNYRWSWHELTERRLIGWTKLSFRDYKLNKLINGDNNFMEFVTTVGNRKLSLLTQAGVDYTGEIDQASKETADVLSSAEDGYKIMLPHQYPTYTSQAPFFYSDSKRVLFVEPRDEYGYQVTNAFAVPSKAYFPDMKVKLDEDVLAIVPHPPEDTWVKLEKPFFDADRPYFIGNTASDMVIDRAQTTAPSYGRASTPTGTGWITTGAETTVVEAPDERESIELRGISEPGADTAIATIKKSLVQEELYSGLINLGSKYWVGKKYRFYSFHHPYVPLVIQQLNRYGVKGLLAPTSDHKNGWNKLKRQQATEGYFDSYGPNTHVVEGPEEYPKDEFDFDFAGAYSQYNWELFFHAPLLIAERLMQNQKFEEAQKWFHYIFDPTETEGTEPDRFWKVKPFYNYKGETSIEKLMKLLNEGDKEAEVQVEAWEDNPFNPHLIARMRTVAYMRTVVIKYLDNLIAWGDDLFRRDTMESINEATQIYVLAAQILGRKPERIEKTDVSAYTFNELFITGLDKFRNASVPVESFLPWMTSHKAVLHRANLVSSTHCTSVFPRTISCWGIGTP